MPASATKYISNFPYMKKKGIVKKAMEMRSMLVTSVAYYSTGKEYHKTVIQLLPWIRINLFVHCRYWTTKTHEALLHYVDKAGDQGVNPLYCSQCTWKDCMGYYC